MQSIDSLCGLMISLTVAGCLVVSGEAESKERQNPKLSGSVGVEYGRDSKVVVEEIDLNTTKGDNFWQLSAKGGVEYQLADKHSVSGSVAVSDKNYANSSPFDLRTWLFSAGYKYKIQKVTVGLDMRRADADLGGNSFLSITQVSPHLSFFMTKKHFFRLAYTRYDKDLKNSPTRDANSDELAVDYYYFMNGLNDYFIGSVKYREDDAKDDVFDNNSYQAKLAYKKRYQLADFPSRLTLQIKYRDRNYEKIINPIVNAHRSDKQFSASVLHRTEVADNFNWLLDITYVNNDSNLTNLNYSESLLSTGVEYQF